jgi:hypothetical protein
VVLALGCSLLGFREQLASDEYLVGRTETGALRRFSSRIAPDGILRDIDLDDLGLYAEFTAHQQTMGAS